MGQIKGDDTVSNRCRFFQLLCCAVIAVVFLNTAAYGAYEQTGSRTIIFRGNLGVEAANKMLSFDVYKGNGSFVDILEAGSTEEYLSIIVCHDQGRTDENGEYSFEFDLPGESGLYTAQISLEGESAPVREEIFFVNTEDFAAAAAKLNSCTSSEEVLEMIETDGVLLGFVSDDYDSLENKKGAAAVLLELIMQNPIDAEERDKGIELFNKAVFTQALNEGQIGNLFLLPQEAGLENSIIKELYNQTFVTEALQTDMTNRLSGRNFTSYAEYQSAVPEAFVLATVKEPNGYNNIKTVLADLEEETGISVSGLSDAVFSGLAGKRFSDYAALLNGINSLRSEGGSVGRPGGGNGGGSGGSFVGGNSGNVNVVIENTDTSEMPQQLLPEIFSDLSDVEWAKDAIISLAERGVINGVGGGLFLPNTFVTREEYVKMIIAAYDMELGGECDFTDVLEDEWYYPYICTAVRYGLIKGMGDGSFGTGQPITRQDLAVISYAAAEENGKAWRSVESEVFDDDVLIADYAKEAVYALKNEGIVNGVGDGNFEPNRQATRAEAAKIIYALLES